MAPISPSQIQSGNFKAAITLCDSKISLLKNKPDRAKKYEALKKAYQAAQTKLNKIVEKCKTIKLASPTDPNKPTFFDEYIAGKEAMVTLAWLSTKLEAVKDAGGIVAESIAVVEGLDFKAKEVDVHYDFIDATKNLTKQITNGTGVSKTITRSCLFVALGELLSRGVTSVLAGSGIMSGSMGLVGLGKLGISQIPKLWPILQSGAQMLMGLPQLTLIAGGAFALFKGIPMIKKHIDGVKKKHKNAQAFDKGMEELMNNQQAHAMA